MTGPPTPREARSLRADTAKLIEFAWSFDRRRVSMQVVLLVFGGLAGGAGLLVLIPIVNAVLQPPDGTSASLGQGLVQGLPLPLLLAAFVGFSALSAAMTAWQATNAIRVQLTLVDRLRMAAFDALLHARWTYILGLRRSDMLEAVTIGAGRSAFAFQVLTRAAADAVIFAVTAVIAIAVSPLIGTVAFVAVLALGAVQAVSVRPSYRLGADLGVRNREMMSTISNSMDALRLIRAHGVVYPWLDRLHVAFLDTREVQISQTRRSATASAASAMVGAVGAACLVLVGVAVGVAASTLAMIIVLAARLVARMQSLVHGGALLAGFLPAVGDMAATVSDARAAAEHGAEAPADSSTRAPGPTADVASARVEFRDVSFQYGPNAGGVLALTFEIPAGRVTALTGPSGAGKSTTADLTLGLLSPESGAVVVDGTGLTPDRLPWWRRQVAYVPQETVLIDGTLRENLAWSAGRDVSDDACWDALDHAEAGFTRQLPDGLDTLIGDRGIRLSGGERQRVAIARALLRQPRLLVLDEATSSLDEETETAILDLFRTLVPQVTLLVIAHRRSTVAAADQVIRLVGGRIVST